MAALLDWWVTIKKDKHSKHCHYPQKKIVFLSIDGMLGREYLSVLTQFSRNMAEKLDKLISHILGWINVRISITVARSYSSMICKAQLHSPRQDRELDWDI